MLKEFKIKTTEKQQIINITDKVREIIESSGIKSGCCIVYVPHSTAGILINENHDPSVREDIIEQMDEFIPESKKYKHDEADNNAHAHIKASIIGPSETIMIKQERLKLGRWQGIGLTEFDGPRDERSVYVKIIED